MKKRLFILIAMLVVLSLVPFASSAQTPNCFELSAEDCAIITSAAENSQQNMTSWTQSFGLTVTGDGLEVLAAAADGVPAAFSLTVNGSGPFAFTPDDMDAPVTFALPMVVNIDDMEIPMELALTNGFLYTDLPGELVGFPLSAAEDELPMPEDTPGNLAELLDLGADATGGAAAGADQFLGSFVNYVRLADADVMGQTVYPFEFALDVTALLNSPEFQQGLTQASGLLGALGVEGEDAADFEMIFQLLPMLLSGVESDLAITQSVGADDNFIHRIEIDFNFAIDLGMLMGAGGGADAPEVPPITVGVNFWVEMSDINAPVTVAVPEGARELTEEEAEEILGGLEETIGGLLGGGF